MSKNQSTEFSSSEDVQNPIYYGENIHISHGERLLDERKEKEGKDNLNPFVLWSRTNLVPKWMVLFPDLSSWDIDETKPSAKGFVFSVVMRSPVSQELRI